jgi:hypothetical protein
MQEVLAACRFVVESRSQFHQKEKPHNRCLFRRQTKKRVGCPEQDISFVALLYATERTDKHKTIDGEECHDDGTKPESAKTIHYHATAGRAAGGRIQDVDRSGWSGSLDRLVEYLATMQKSKTQLSE